MFISVMCDTGGLEIVNSICISQYKFRSRCGCNEYSKSYH